MKDLKDCKTLNDIARQEFGKANYTNREKCKKLLEENGINWRKWLDSKKIGEKKYCLYCGKELTGKDKKRKKFCNNSCAASYNNIGVVRNGSKSTPHLCANCGKEIGNRGKFCGTACQNEYYRKQYIERWKKGEENGLCGEYGLSNHIRRYLLEKYNCKCEKCGWGEENPYTHTIPLEIHHMDGDYKNNKEENLQVLCPNCHSLTETHKSHNKMGRVGRKKYHKCHE